MDSIERIIMKHTGLSPNDGDTYDEVRAACEEAMRLAASGQSMGPNAPRTAEQLYKMFPMNKP